MDRNNDNYEPNFILRDSNCPDSDGENLQDNLQAADEGAPAKAAVQQKRNDSEEYSAAWAGRDLPDVILEKRKVSQITSALASRGQALSSLAELAEVAGKAAL